MRDLLIEGASEIATPVGSAPRRGVEQGRVLRRKGGEVFCQAGRIAFIGDSTERKALFGELPAAARLDVTGKTIVPGFVDCHTHLPWGGSREHELSERLAGKTYQEIAAAGGGILSTMAATRGASEQDLVALTLARLDRMLVHGTTTAEAKSGYGLSLSDELKQLRAIRSAGERHPITVVPTLLAAHEFPPEHRGNREAWVREICDAIVPAVGEAGLARFCDVFCERGVFDVDQSRRVLEAGRAHGLVPRLHADEFVDSGGALLAAELGAASADHLIAPSDEGMQGMARAGVTAVLLPGVSFFLRKSRFAPAREFIDASVPVALATDCNPGSSHTESLPMIIWLAIFHMGLSVSQCLTAVTLNSACVLGLGREIGSLETGKRADLTVLDGPNLDHLAYHFGVNPVTTVVKDGCVVFQAGNLAGADPPRGY